MTNTNELTVRMQGIESCCEVKIKLIDNIHGHNSWDSK